MRKAILMLIVFLTVGICQAAIDWEYLSPLTVTETITDIGGGDYQYEYSFENVDISPIWYFGVFSDFTTVGDQSFFGHNWVGPHVGSVSASATELDGRNLDSDIMWLTVSSYEAGAGGDPSDSILIDESAFGFSYIASVYDTTPKHYFYCAIGTEAPWYSESGKVTAVGTTVPEPVTLFLFSFGILALRSHRR